MRKEPIDPEPTPDDVAADGGDEDETMEVATDSHLVEAEKKT